MKLFIHDLPKETFDRLFPNLPEDTDLVSPDQVCNQATLGRPPHPCTGCFGCWVKTPGACVIQDRYNQMGALLASCEELVLISRCVYGGFSPFVKNILDRSISYLHPDFLIKNDQMHHLCRYPHHFELTICFYQTDMSAQEHDTARKLALSLATNLDCKIKKIYFVPNVSRMGGLNL